jgi:hypothetical protein
MFAVADKMGGVGEVEKKQEVGMTLTPPWAGEQSARRRAHGLLDEKPKASQPRK